MIPSLPFELTQNIIRLSLPRLLLNTSQKRLNTLKSCSLVDSTWNNISRSEMWKHLFVKDSEGVLDDTVIKELKSMKEADIVIMTKSIHLYSNWAGKCDWKLLPELLSKCGEVEEIWMYGIELSDILEFESFEWSTLRNLKSIHFINCRITKNASLKFTFPSVKHVTFYNLYASTSCEYSVPDQLPTAPSSTLFFEKFFDVSIFPSLESIAYFQHDDGSSLPILEPLNISSQIKRLVYFSNRIDDDGEMVSATVENFESLSSLVLQDFKAFKSGSLEISNLKSLGILHYSNKNLVEEVQSLQDWLIEKDVTHQLKSLKLPRLNSQLSEDEQEAVDKLEIFINSRGLEVTFLDHVNGYDEMINFLVANAMLEDSQFC